MNICGVIQVCSSLLAHTAKPTSQGLRDLKFAICEIFKQ